MDMPARQHSHTSFAKKKFMRNSQVMTCIGPSRKRCRIESLRKFHSNTAGHPRSQPRLTSRIILTEQPHRRKARPLRGSRRTPSASVAANPQTGTQLFANLTGYCILVGSCLRSVPQIVRILKNKSAEGVSLTAQYAELIAYSITVAYNVDRGYPFSTYGDTAACWLQDIVLILLITTYRGQLGLQTCVAGVVVCGGCWTLLSGLISRPALAVMQASTILIIALGGRIPQIILNHKRGNSGELSPTTSGLNLAGNLARIFTTLVLTQDVINLVGTIVQACLNAILVWQSMATALTDRQKPGPPDKQLIIEAT